MPNLPPPPRPANSNSDSGISLRKSAQHSAPPELNEDERLTAMLCHASSLLWLPLLLLGIPIPFANILLPFLVWLVKREDSSWIDRHGRESINFQISMFIYSVILIMLSVAIAIVMLLILNSQPVGTSAFTYLLGFVLLGYGSFVLFWSVIQLVLVVWASIWAQRGRKFRYPLTIRFLSTPRL